MNRVPIVFCFDDNYSSQAAVAIASLLKAKDQSTKYIIYCIVPSQYKRSNEKKIRRIVKCAADLSFVRAGKNIEGGYETRGISSAAYYRLCIHDLIPNEDKVIYSDVDVLFVNDLFDTYSIKIKENLIGAVKSITNYNVHDKRINEIEYWDRNFGDIRDRYVNSGFLLMNLSAIRQSGLGKRWVEMSKENYVYQDQDILNITCKNKIIFLPPSLCKLTYISDATYLECKGRLFTEKEINDVINNPIIIHYAGEKPWNYRSIAYSDLWWSFLSNYPGLYIGFFVRYFRVRIGRKISEYLSPSEKL